MEINSASKAKALILKLTIGAVVLEIIKDLVECDFCTAEQAACDCFKQLDDATANQHTVAIKRLCEKLNVDNKFPVCSRLLALSATNQTATKAFLDDVVDLQTNMYHLNAETNLPTVNVATVEAWKMVYDAKGGLRYRKDKPLLDQVAKMRANQTVLSNLGGEDALKDIIFKNKFAPCNTCSGGSSTYSLMHHYLIDVAYFAQNYANNRPGFDLVKGNQGMRNKGGHQVAATAFTIRTLHNAGIVASITGFEIQIETINDAGETNTAFADILQEGNKIIECKSWALNGTAFQNFVAGTSGSVTQFKTYLSGQIRVTSMNQLEYWFDGKKGVTESQVKEKFKQMMYNGTTLTTQGIAVFNAIWGNVGLRGSLFGNRTQDAARTFFESFIPDLNNSFYEIIKIK